MRLLSSGEALMEYMAPPPARPTGVHTPAGTAAAKQRDAAHKTAKTTVVAAQKMRVIDTCSLIRHVRLVLHKATHHLIGTRFLASELLIAPKTMARLLILSAQYVSGLPPDWMHLTNSFMIPACPPVLSPAS